MCYLLKRLRKEAESYKSRGNEQFKAGDYQESANSYTLALRTCPLTFDKDRAIMYANRAAAKVKLVSFKVSFSYQESDNHVSIIKLSLLVIYCGLNLMVGE